MLYHLYETQRAFLSPLADFAQAASRLYSNPVSPLSHLPIATRLSAGFDLTHRLLKDYEKPEFDIHRVELDGHEVVVQTEVAMEKPFCRLLHFRRYGDEPHTLAYLKSCPRVLIVAPLSGHHATLLRDTVRTLLPHHDVYITEWVDARFVPLDQGFFHLDDYVHYVQEFLRHIGPTANVISVCQPTVPTLVAVSLMASRGEPTPRTMVMMGGPIDARRSPTRVNSLAQNRSLAWFESNVIYRVPSNFPGSGRRVYPGFLQHAGFVAMNPDRHMDSHYEYFLQLLRGDEDDAEAHRRFYDEYNAVLDMDAAYYLDTIRAVFQEFRLMNHNWVVAGEPVRPQDIHDTALLTIEGELDDISGAGQTQAAHDLCTGIPEARRHHITAEHCGHYGIFSGRRWREHIYPQLKDFIAQHQHQRKAVRAS